jgi:type VII secretion protein EccB
VGSRQDQLHAHQYSIQRVVSALVTHNPDPAHSPLNRSGNPAVAGVIVAAMIAGGFGLYGYFNSQSTVKDLRDATAIFVEESGAQYVYYQPDDSLHPVLNYASAKLIAGTPQAPARRVDIKQAGLAKVQRETGIQLGAVMGILDAPDSVPAPADLIQGPWWLCSESTTATSGRPTSRIMIGADRPGAGHVLAAPAAGRIAEALHVSDPAGSQYLIYANHRFLIRNPAAVLTAFGWPGHQPTPVATAWLNAIPSDGDITPVSIDSLRKGATVLDQRIGQLYRTAGPDNRFRWAVLAKDGVFPISEIQAGLLAADRATMVGEPITLSAADFSALPPSKTNPAIAGGQELLPSTVPNLVPIARAACVTVPDAASTVTEVVVDPARMAGDISVARSPGTVDRVDVPLGRGVLVEAAPSSRAPSGSGTMSLITAAGERHSIADKDSLAKLGFAQTTALRMPAAVVAGIPEGPPLSIAAAQKLQG